MKRRLVLVVLLLAAALVVLRVAIAPRALPPPDLRPIDVKAPAIDLAPALAQARVLLLGESHGDATPQRCGIDLLNALGGKIVLVLELPQRAQARIDAGDVDGAVEDALDLRELLRWGRAHAVAVVAADEDRLAVIRNRALATDTRNQTMADAVSAAAARYPDARVVFYGGMLHTLKGGRYMFDHPSRVPMAPRVTGVDARGVVTVVISDEPSLARGAYRVDGALGALPAEQLVRAPLAGVARADEIADFVLSCPRR